MKPEILSFFFCSFCIRPELGLFPTSLFPSFCKNNLLLEDFSGLFQIPGLLFWMKLGNSSFFFGSFLAFIRVMHFHGEKCKFTPPCRLESLVHGLTWLVSYLPVLGFLQQQPCLWGLIVFGFFFFFFLRFQGAVS